MVEESDDMTITPEDMEGQNGDMNLLDDSSAKEASDNITDHLKIESGIVAEEETDKLADGITDVANQEEGEYLRVNSDTAEGLVKNSPTKETDFAAGELRKKPALVIVGQYYKFNVRSRYLSDSAGSCHDYCKYGHKHESEKKTKKLMLRTIRETQTVKRTTSDDLETCVQVRTTKKKELYRRLSLPGPIPEKTPIMQMDDKNLLKKDVNRQKMKRIASEIKPSAVSSPGTSSRSKTDIQAIRKTMTQSSILHKRSTEKVKETKIWNEVGMHSNGEKMVKAKEPMCSSPESSLKKEGGYSTGIKEIKVREPMSNSPKTPLKKSPSMKARLYKNRKSSSCSKPEEAKVDGHEDIQEKTLYMIEPNSNMKPPGRTSNAVLSAENPRNTPRTTRVEINQGSKGTRKGSGVSVLSSSSQKSTRPQREEQQGSYATKKKQTGIKTEDGGSKTSTPREKSTESRRMKKIDFKNTKQINTLREDWRFKTNTSKVKPTVDHKLKLKRGEKSYGEDKDGSAWKVKFKRGTVVALQVANNAPKKLRFKRGRTLGEDQNAKAEAERKSKNDCDIVDEPHDAKTGPEKVRLRHQKASEKKDDVDLNNVIEETASQLVKTRKSKVKALVGAFETVMSLRERKHLVDTGAS